MKTFRKVIGVPNQSLTNFELVPEDMINKSGGNIDVEMQEEQQQKKGNPIRQHAIDKQRKLLMVILQLAKNNAYTDDLQIRLKDGSLLEQNQFINLLNYALSPGKALAGVNEFVEVLHQSRVTPEMLINENVKVLLRNFYQKKGQMPSRSAQTQTSSRAQSTLATQTVPRDTSELSTQTVEPVASSTEPLLQEPSVAGPSYPSTKNLPEPPDEDFDTDEPIDEFNESSRGTKRKIDRIEEPGPRRSTRVRLEPNRLQVGTGWEPYDSDDEI